MPISICATASSVSEKIAKEPIERWGGLHESEMLEKSQISVNEISEFKM